MSDLPEHLWTHEEVVQMLMDDYGLSYEEAEELMEYAVTLRMVDPPQYVH